MVSPLPTRWSSQKLGVLSTVPSLKPENRVGTKEHLRNGERVELLRHMGHKSHSQTRGKAAIPEGFTEVAGQDAGQRQMTGVPGSLGISHEALAFYLSARKLLPWLPLARDGQIWGRESGLPKAPNLHSEACGWGSCWGQQLVSVPGAQRLCVP